MQINKSHIAANSGNNITRILDLATRDELSSGKVWYARANGNCRRIFEQFQGTYSLAVIAGMTAALSPRNKWDKNILDVENLLLSDEATVSTFNANKSKALKIKYLDRDDVLGCLGGDKVRSFYQNILEPENRTVVTIDSHAIGVWLGSRVVGVSAAGDAYRIIGSAYINYANELGLIPNQLQAITWLAYKRIHNIK